SKPPIQLSKSTVNRWVKGGRSIQEFNQTKQWLTVAEEDMVVETVIGTARQAFPVMLRCIEEQANAICDSCYGAAFPETGVGTNWASRFLEHHHDRL
ncbi:hypothetical protein BJ165DRAFT_1305420, partial [Panaeolus papilionaceus]